jgi:CHAT domain-containing protein
VACYRNGGHSVITASEARHVDKPVLARPHTVCEIALGTHVTTIRVELPAVGGTAFFKAQVEIQWTVTDHVAFVVPPGSPADAGEEVTSLRARLGAKVTDVGVLTERAALTALIEGEHAGLLHFACHNAFTGTGSCVTMADGSFDLIDLASAAQVLNAGAGAFVGTLWPVLSQSALQFAEAFYDELITRRQPLGQASLAARQTIRDLHGGDPTWLAYAVYGSPAARAHTTG